MREKIIAGIDVGTTSVRAIIGGLGRDGKLRVLGVGISSCEGARKGSVVNVDDVSKSIKRAVDGAERASGVSLVGAYVSVGGVHIECASSKGVVAVSRPNGEISQEDINRAISASQSFPLSPNKEILHIIPREFKVDNESGIKDPKGLHGVRLEVDSLIIEASSPFVKNLVKAVEGAGVDVLGLVFAPLAAGRAILSNRQKEIGSLVLDIGGETSGLAVFEEGNVIHAAVLPVGSSHITGDLAIALRISIDEAEKIKINYGTCLPEEISKKDFVKIPKAVSPSSASGNKPGAAAGQSQKKSSEQAEENAFSRKEIAGIIKARACDIFELVNKELKKINRVKLLPSGVIVLGGGAKLGGIVELAKDETHLPAEIGFPVELDGVFDKISDPSFAVLIGLLLWGFDDATEGKGHRGVYSGLANLSASSFVGFLKKVFKILTP